MNIQNRTIYHKDNLDILRGIDSETVDLIYLDPPFNTNKTWEGAAGSDAEDASFKDTWTGDDIKKEWVDAIRAEHVELHKFLSGMKFWAGESDVAYITYMAVRIIECRRILKSTGSLYYHCDHYMNDYVKVMLDIIFGRHHDVNNLVWTYGLGGSSKRAFSKKHDNIFLYSKTKDYYFNKPQVPATSSAMKGKMKGMPDVFTDIPSLNNMAKERTGYPTQKPLALLRRLIGAACPEDGIVLDPFCGCATTCVAAEQLGRQWIGIDVSIKAYELVKDRLDIDAASDLFEERVITYRNTAPIRSNSDSRESKYVYVISNAAFPDEYKVGIASNFKSRLNGYQTSDPNRAYKEEFKMLTPDYREIEKFIHEKFPNKHEWVQAPLEDIIEEIRQSKIW